MFEKKRMRIWTTASCCKYVQTGNSCSCRVPISKDTKRSSLLAWRINISSASWESLFLFLTRVKCFCPGSPRIYGFPVSHLVSVYPLLNVSSWVSVALNANQLVNQTRWDTCGRSYVNDYFCDITKGDSSEKWWRANVDFFTGPSSKDEKYQKVDFFSTWRDGV